MMTRSTSVKLRSRSANRIETGLIETLRPTALVREDEVIGPAYKNARGVGLKEGEAVLTDIGVWGREMGISLDGTGQVLIKNFAFAHRRSMDPYGAGILSERRPRRPA